MSDWSSDVCSSDLRLGPASEDRSSPPSETTPNTAPSQRCGKRRRCASLIATQFASDVCIGQTRRRTAGRLQSSGSPRLSGSAQTPQLWPRWPAGVKFVALMILQWPDCRSEEHTSELQSLMRNSYAVFCLKKTINKRKIELSAHDSL